MKFHSLLMLAALAFPLVGHAESFTPLGHKMHDLENVMMTFEMPGFTQETPLAAAQEGQKIAAELRDKAADYAPPGVKEQPKILALFRQSFVSLADAFGVLAQACALPDTDATKTAQIDAAVKHVRDISTAAHASFQRPGGGRPVPPPRVKPVIAPIDRDRDKRSDDELTGDNPGPAHRLLWTKAEYIQSIGGKLPEPSETVDVVIVGGGMSGLISAYQLRDQKPVVFDQAERLGGNSRGESWKGIDYSIGATYFDVPEKGSDVETFLRELGLDGKYAIHKSAEDPIFLRGVKYEKIWDNGTTPESKAQFNLLKAHFLDMAAGRNGLVYPELPVTDASQRGYVNQLDGQSMKAYLEKVVGGPLNADVGFVLDRYFWSAFAGTISEVSAASGLNFFVADFEKVAVAPGGNAAIAQALFEKIQTAVPAENLRAQAVVFDVKVDEGGVNVAYMDASNRPKVIRAKQVVMAAPKFVAARLIDDLEPARAQAIQSLRYRSYLVANVLLNQKLDPSFYDVYFTPKTGPEPLDISHGFPAATDAVYANYANVDGAHTILTLFRPIPADGVRPEALFGPEGSADVLKAQFQKQLAETLLPSLGVDPTQVGGIRIARWGHPLPLAATGLIAAGAPEAISAPYKGRVTFVNQDNWALPSFETVFAEATKWSRETQRALNAKAAIQAATQNAQVAPMAACETLLVAP